MTVKGSTAGMGFRAVAIGSAVAAGSFLTAIAWELLGLKSDRNPELFMALSASLCLFWPAVGVALVGLAIALAGRRGLTPSGSGPSTTSGTRDAGKG